MTKIANTVQTYDVKGMREQLADIIYNISPTETPFMSNAPRGSVRSTFNEFQQDALAAPSTTNQQIEGDDVSAFAAIVPTVRVGNYTQISTKTLIVSDTEEIVEKAGRKSEIGYQLGKLGKELKRDMETMLLSNIGANAGAAATARKTAGLPAWVKSNTDKGATGADPVYTTVPTATRTDGTARPFTETILKSVIQKCWVAGAEPSTVMLSATQKQAASGFSGIATRYKEVKGNTAASIIGAADVYVSDFGQLSIVPNRFQRNSDGWVLDFDYVSVDFLRPFKTETLAKTGDAEKRFIVTEYMLRVKHEGALGLCADLQ